MTQESISTILKELGHVRESQGEQMERLRGLASQLNLVDKKVTKTNGTVKGLLLWKGILDDREAQELIRAQEAILQRKVDRQTVADQGRPNKFFDNETFKKMLMIVLVLSAAVLLALGGGPVLEKLFS